MGTYENAWWNISDTECTVEEIKKALESTVITDLLPLSTSGDITVSGIVISIVFST
jgi:gamma-aminobutyric acid type B receptor